MSTVIMEIRCSMTIVIKVAQDPCRS